MSGHFTQVLCTTLTKEMACKHPLPSASTWTEYEKQKSAEISPVL
jgi:hypothetical protein